MNQLNMNHQNIKLILGQRQKRSIYQFLQNMSNLPMMVMLLNNLNLRIESYFRIPMNMDMDFGLDILQMHQKPM